MFVRACFIEEVKNDPGIQIRHWYMSYELLQKSVFMVIRGCMNLSGGQEEE